MASVICNHDPCSVRGTNILENSSTKLSRNRMWKLWECLDLSPPQDHVLDMCMDVSGTWSLVSTSTKACGKVSTSTSLSQRQRFNVTFHHSHDLNVNVNGADVRGSPRNGHPEWSRIKVGPGTLKVGQNAGSGECPQGPNRCPGSPKCSPGPSKWSPVTASGY